MQSAKAFAPANLSCVFVIRKTKKPEKSGSLGLGFTVNKGALVAIKKIPIINNSFKKLINNKQLFENKKIIKKININNKIEKIIKNNKKNII